MGRRSNGRLRRITAGFLAASITLLALPLDGFAFSCGKPAGDTSPTKKGTATVKQPCQVDARRLSAVEMHNITGRGRYRNPYFCGTSPWHRSFRDVNLCTGNLFKSFTDIQVAPARGAGLVLQRTYNSNDSRIGPFGRGWTHAYEIRMEEAVSVNPNDPDAANVSVRTDFFGGKHRYTRDADGLYTPPPYMHDWTKSDYKTVLEVGPGDVLADIEIDLSGTEKHFVADGNERICDYMKDRHGNTTTLEYTSYTVRAGVAKRLLTKVTDPVGRELNLVWQPLTPSDPSDYRYRITDATGPLQTVHYDYYMSSSEPGAGGEAYNLKAVHLDPAGINRTTTYTYMSCAGTGETEYGLLASIVDPLGHAVTYEYKQSFSNNPTGTVWVTRITEPGGVDENNNPRTLAWNLGRYYYMSGFEYEGSQGEPGTGVYVSFDEQFRAYAVSARWMQYYPYSYTFDYDTANNVVSRFTRLSRDYYGIGEGHFDGRQDNYTYGRHGNVLTHWIEGYSVQVGDKYSPQEEYTYYPEDYYFQKKSFKDMAGHVTTFGYGSRYDANLGNRGSLLWVRDAYYNPDNPHQFSYTYNEFGQAISETSPNDVVTEYHFDDQWGNLTQIVQDTGQGHLNRTTDLAYDAAGRIVSRTDPNRLVSTVDYNPFGQPLVVSYPATANTPTETIVYNYGTDGGVETALNVGNGRIESLADNRGTTTFEYELGSDRIKSITDPITGPISYTYTRRGSIATRTLPDGETFTYTYNTWDSLSWYWMACYGMLSSDDPNSFCELLSNIKDDSGRIVCEYWDYSPYGGEKFNIKYDESGNPISYCTADYYYEGVKKSSNYTRGFLHSLVNTFHWKDAQGQWQSELLSQNQYMPSSGDGYDVVGNRLYNHVTLKDANGQYQTWTETYGYDALSRLVNATYSDTGQTCTYAFDRVGNRISDSPGGTPNYAYNNADMLISHNGQSYVNDANGNTVSGGGRNNIWDSQNRLVLCTYGSTTSTFIYGHDGLRRSSIVNGVVTHFLLDGDDVVREIRNGSNHSTYLVGSRGTEFRRDDTTGQIKWYLYDGLGSVLAEVDEDGNITATRKYDVYGALRGITGSSTSKHGFVGGVGHLAEPETGSLIYMRARWMDPVIGRFVSEDPAQSGINWYAYCDNNPVSRYDESGCDWNQGQWTGKGGKWMRLDTPHGGQGQYHLHYGKGGVQWGAVNADGSLHDAGKFVKPMDREMQQAVKRSSKLKKLGFANDSISAAWQADQLFVIALFLDLMGRHSDASQLDRLNGYLD